MKKFGLVLLSAFSLVACSQYATNGERIYLQSRNGVKLIVPPPLTTANISYFYVLPPQTDNPRVNITPPGLP